MNDILRNLEYQSVGFKQTHNSSILYSGSNQQDRIYRHNNSIIVEKPERKISTKSTKTFSLNHTIDKD